MELRQLRYFVAVAEELHFGRAAYRLRIAQPALSRQIQALEKDLLVQLLFRNRRRVQVTPAGQVFLERARLILARADEAVLATQRAGGGVSGTLNLGFVGSATYDVLPSVLREFLQAAPHVDLTLSEMTVHAQIEALTEKRIDIGLLRLPAKTEGLVFRRIAREPLYVALPGSHRLADSRRCDCRHLRESLSCFIPTILDRAGRNSWWACASRRAFGPSWCSGRWRFKRR